MIQRLRLQLEYGITILGWEIRVFRCTGCGEVYHIELNRQCRSDCIPF